MAALGSPELPAPLQSASSILGLQPLRKVTLSLLGLRMEELGALSERRLTLVVMAMLKKHCYGLAVTAGLSFFGEPAIAANSL